MAIQRKAFSAALLGLALFLALAFPAGAQTQMVATQGSAEESTQEAAGEEENGGGMFFLPEEIERWGIVVSDEGVMINDVLCPYTINGDSVRVTYPNGVVGWFDYNDRMGGSGGYDYNSAPEGFDWDDMEGYPDIMTLDGAIRDYHSASLAGKSRNGGGYKLLAGVLLLLGGAFNLLVPQAAWALNYGWRYKNAEPSDAALRMGRLGGVIAILVGIGCIIWIFI